MTCRTNARIAGFTFLAYIALAFPAMVLFDRATPTQGIASKLVGIAQHAADVRVSIVLSLIACFAALVLAVTLYRITRDQDHELATLAMCCRVGEGLLGACHVLATVGLLWLATSGPARLGTSAPDAAVALGAFLLKVQGSGTTIAATFFAVGSALFSYLMLRGRMIPASLAWVGVIASVLLVVALPLQLAGLLRGPVIALLWLPMATFEIPLGVWLMVKGVAAPAGEVGEGSRASERSSSFAHAEAAS